MKVETVQDAFKMHQKAEKILLAGIREHFERHPDASYTLSEELELRNGYFFDEISKNGLGHTLCWIPFEKLKFYHIYEIAFHIANLSPAE